VQYKQNTSPMFVEFIYSKEIKGLHYRGGIMLEAEAIVVHDAEACILDLSFQNENSLEYPQSVKFGVCYFWEQFRKKQTGGVILSVEVFAVHTLLMDTNAAIIVYSTVMALCKATGFKIDGFEISTEGILCLPIN
jgi:hypothetical protein